ncbi:general odorant-binding protein 56d-like [Anopheles bellator]|uniref:general odorant-binding protein 56d-like n=1 Tax=Anopheles bellator TaxID=139047 RepID=UPI0026488573|nr:general odorant-binding protein 56d-like [Anopheles bellator]
MQLLLVSVLLAAFAVAQPLTEEQQKKSDAIAVGCLDKHKTLNREDLKLLRGGDFSKVDAETKCFLRCFLQDAKFMDADGKLDSALAIERLSLSQDKAKVEALVTKCSVQQADPCETAFKAIECYQQEKSSLL